MFTIEYIKTKLVTCNIIIIIYIIIIVYCRENDHQTLLRLCEQESNNNEVGNIQFDDSFAEKVVRFLMCEELVVYIVTFTKFTQSVEGRLELLRQAIKRYRDAQNYFALKVSLDFMCTYTHCITLCLVC